MPDSGVWASRCEACSEGLLWRKGRMVDDVKNRDWVETVERLGGLAVTIIGAVLGWRRFRGA